MPDPTPDVVALADQVKVLSGDLNRRFELLNSRIDKLSGGIEQLNSRIELNTTHKVVLPFAAALDGFWLEGTTNPEFNTALMKNFQFSGIGNMFVVLPNLSRIGVFRASVRISDAVITSVFTKLNISLQRTGIDGNNSEPIVPLSCPVVPGAKEPQGDPVLGKEWVDIDRFKYFVSAELVYTVDISQSPSIIPLGKVVLESFKVECIVA